MDSAYEMIKALIILALALILLMGGPSPITKAIKDVPMVGCE